MKKLIIALLVIVSLLLVGCEKTITGETTLQTEKVCECPNIDLSEYNKRLGDLQEQTRTLRKQLGILTNELYTTKEELNVTKISQEELEQLKKELEEDIDRVDTKLDYKANKPPEEPPKEDCSIDLRDYPENCYLYPDS